ncbi:SWIM zinc finger family protein/mitogen-activated protein kinase kinase kinase (MAPKKK)-related [Forsythia ovata]|uniref:SWIM zinc finger family protein/mitogen-activated protein kinase kinase kinase (MAPKKK)-related n=1 Tax=Forsythia ovata TaxID=205694 RepID=A0ABD1W5G3_9LAMI
MDSSTSATTPASSPQHPYRFTPTQPLTDRVIRALQHRLHLLHRADSMFFVLGATGNVYTVNLSTVLSCTCPDRTVPCKHILFVMIRVLRIPLDDSCLRRRSLRPCQLHRLLSLPTSAEAYAGDQVRERFRLLFFQATPSSSQPCVEVDGGATCPVCLEEMKKEDKVVACGACKNGIHEECLLAWKRSRRRRSATCVLCRARWRNIADQEKYLNLSAYINENDMPRGHDGQCGD